MYLTLRGNFVSDDLFVIDSYNLNTQQTNQVVEQVFPQQIFVLGFIVKKLMQIIIIRNYVTIA